MLQQAEGELTVEALSLGLSTYNHEGHSSINAADLS